MKPTQSAIVLSRGR